MRTLESGSAPTETDGVRQYDVRLTTTPNTRSVRIALPMNRNVRAIRPRRLGDVPGAAVSLDFAGEAPAFDGFCFFLELRNAI